MTDKQIIIDGVDVSGCEFYNKDDKTCREANGKYNIDICDFDKCENSNCYYKQLKAKEQECKELKNIINEAKNSKLDLKSFLVGEAIQNEYEQQLDQLKEQLEAYKMEAEEGKEINAELKAENEELREIIWNIDVNRQSKGKKLIRIEELLKKCATGYTDEFIQEMFSILYELEPICRYNKLEKYTQTLTEIKEIAEHCINQDICTFCDYSDRCYIEDEEIPTYDVCKLVLQKISEVEDGQ